MKILIVSLAFYLASSPLVYGASKEDAKNEVSTTRFCKAVSRFAETVMKGHQEGLSMATVMERLEGTAINRDVYKKIVVLAYSEPRYLTENMKRRVIEEFRDKIYLQCFTSNSK